MCLLYLLNMMTTNFKHFTSTLLLASICVLFTHCKDDEPEAVKDIPRDGLVAFYPFNGNAKDASGNNLDGTVTGCALTTDRFGNSGRAYAFDGDGDYIDMGNPELLQISDRITIAGWFSANQLAASKSIVTKIFFDPEQGYNPTRGYRIGQGVTGGGKPYAVANVYSTEGLTISHYLGNELEADTWTFFALTIHNKDFKYYHNGELVDEQTIGGDVNILNDGTLGNLVIGAYNGGFVFDGKIDDITIYNRALSAEEVMQLYEQTVSNK